MNRKIAKRRKVGKWMLKQFRKALIENDLSEEELKRSGFKGKLLRGGRQAAVAYGLTLVPGLSAANLILYNRKRLGKFISSAQRK